MQFAPTLSAISCALLSATSSIAQSDIVPASPQSRPIAIVHAVVHTATEGQPVIEDGHVIFDGGRILSVGSGLPEFPANCEVFDAKGMHVSPGFCVFPTTMGLVETLQVEATDDRREFGELRPEAAPLVAINPDSDLLAVARAAGILLAGVVPEGGLVSGSASLIKLDGWTPEDLEIDRSFGVVVTWPMVEPARSISSRRSPEEQRRRAKEDLDKLARFFDEMKAVLDARAADSTVAHDVRADAMRDVLSGRDPIFVEVGSASQIESAIAWTKARGLRAVIVGGDGIESAIPLLKSERIAVVLRGIHRLPGQRHAPTDAAYSLPKKLADAGILFSITTGDEPAHDRNLPHHAATAAAFGLDREAALRAVTANPCAMAGVLSRYGTIEPLKSATIIVTRGHPLELTSDVAAAWIDGRSIDLDSHQSQMKAKYETKIERSRGAVDASTR
ncbi:MAG: hypothetical protein QM516_00080 [Limnohabitans sp.]|nr:hypothetical protein [Limnohabitans sp.]